MNTKISLFLLLIFGMLTACQASTPSPVTATMDTEFTLAPGQSAVVADTGLTITLDSVPGDDRCPSEVECAASGPVDVSLSVRQGDAPSTSVALQTFTDHEGIAPSVPFEGLTNPVQVGDYLIRLVGVTPYPESPEKEIEPSEYRVTLLVSRP